MELTMDDGLAWLNGELTDFGTAKVAVEDRGFEFGDGIYEMVRVYSGAPFALAEHLYRLARSATGIELQLPMSTDEFNALAYDLLHRSGLDDAEIYLQVTRGVARRSHQFPENVRPTVLMGIRPPTGVQPKLRETGCSVITHSDERWARCDLKTICLLPNVLAKEHACRVGAFEAILVRDSVISEGTASNVFIRIGGELITPIADNRILAGITRAMTIELARKCYYEVVERDIKMEELFEAEEVLLTSTTIELLPVIKINDHIVANVRPGAVVERLQSEYRFRAEGKPSSKREKVKPRISDAVVESGEVCSI